MCSATGALPITRQSLPGESSTALRYLLHRQRICVAVCLSLFLFGVATRLRHSRMLQPLMLQCAGVRRTCCSVSAGPVTLPAVPGPATDYFWSLAPCTRTATTVAPSSTDASGSSASLRGPAQNPPGAWQRAVAGPSSAGKLIHFGGGLAKRPPAAPGSWVRWLP